MVLGKHANEKLMVLIVLVVAVVGLVSMSGGFEEVTGDFLKKLKGKTKFIAKKSYVGDNAKGSAAVYEITFTPRSMPRKNIPITLSTYGIVSKGNKHYKRGHYKDRVLFFNDKNRLVHVEELNKYVSKEKKKTKINFKLKPGSLTKNKVNKMVILAGIKGNNYDDFIVYYAKSSMRLKNVKVKKASKQNAQSYKRLADAWKPSVIPAPAQPAGQPAGGQAECKVYLDQYGRADSFGCGQGQKCYDPNMKTCEGNQDCENGYVCGELMRGLPPHRVCVKPTQVSSFECSLQRSHCPEKHTCDFSERKCVEKPHGEGTCKNQRELNHYGCSSSPTACNQGLMCIGDPVYVRICKIAGGQPCAAHPNDCAGILECRLTANRRQKTCQGAQRPQGQQPQCRNGATEQRTTTCWDMSSIVSQRRTCANGRWGAWIRTGATCPVRECTGRDVDEQTQNCGDGSQIVTRRRTCNNGRWGQWVNTGAQCPQAPPPGGCDEDADCGQDRVCNGDSCEPKPRNPPRNTCTEFERSDTDRRVIRRNDFQDGIQYNHRGRQYGFDRNGNRVEWIETCLDRDGDGTKETVTEYFCGLGATITDMTADCIAICTGLQGAERTDCEQETQCVDGACVRR